MKETDWSKLIRELRGKLDLSQEKFAAKLGVSFPTINRWENGRSAPSPLALQRIEQMLLHMKSAGQELLDEYFSEPEL